MQPKKKLSDSDKEYFLSLKPDDITLELLHRLFTDTYDKQKKKVIPSKYNTYDEFSLKKGEYFNKEDIPVTNCGLFIYNKLVVEPELSDVLGYCNKTLDVSEQRRIQGILDTNLMEDNITTDMYINYMNRLTWLSFSFNSEICTSLTAKSMVELPEVKAAKKKLREKYKDDLESDDNNRATVAAVKMEKELIDIASNVLKDDDAMDLYNSGARGSFSNSYKNSNIMKGPVYNQSKGKFDIMYEPIASGIQKENVPTLGNSIITSAYSTAIASGETNLSAY